MERTDDNRRFNRGTIGNKGGRKKGTVLLPNGPRPGHQIRAYGDEWQIIREFAKLLRKFPDDCKEMVQALKKKELEAHPAGKI